MKPILFTLENCPKCESTKKYLKDIDYDVVEFPHNWQEWTFEQKQLAKKYGVIEDLKETAPILVTDNHKFVGQLRIKRWAKVWS